MSLQLDFTDPTIAGGADFPQAIWRIDQINVPTLAGDMTVVLGVYATKALIDAGRGPIFSRTVPLTSLTLTTAAPAFVSALAARVAAGGVLTPRDALVTALYVLLKQQAPYSAAIDV